MLIIRTTTVPMSGVRDGGYSAEIFVDVFQTDDPNTARVLYEKFREEIKSHRRLVLGTGTRPIPSISVRIEQETL